MAHVLSKIIGLFILALPIIGCGATQFGSQLPPFVLKPGETIELSPIENATGKTLEIPADQIFNEYMSLLLQQRKLLSTLPGQPATLIFKAKLIEYEVGSAAARWLLPGLGTTVCTVHAELLDKKTGALVGNMESRQTVSFGGLYSVGAENYICKRVGDVLIDEIEKKLDRKETPG